MTIQGVEYEVLFDGVHRDCDADLLCCEPVPVKREHVPIEPSHWSITHGRAPGATLNAVLACCSKGPATKPAIVRATGFTSWAVDAALRKLQQDEQVHVVGTTRSTARGRWLRQYASV